MSIVYWTFKPLGVKGSAVNPRVDFTEKNEVEVCLGGKFQVGVRSCSGSSIEITKVSGAKELRVIRRDDEGDGEKCDSYPVELGIGDSFALDGQKWGFYKEQVSARSKNSLADKSDSDFDFSSDSDFDDLDDDDDDDAAASSLVANESVSSQSMLSVFKRYDDDDEEDEDEDEEEEEEVGYGFRFTFGKTREEEIAKQRRMAQAVEPPPQEETKEAPSRPSDVKEKNDNDDVKAEPKKEKIKKLEEPKDTHVNPPQQQQPKPQPPPPPPQQQQQPKSQPPPQQKSSSRAKKEEEKKKVDTKHQQPVAPKPAAPATPKQPEAKVAYKPAKSKMVDEIREIFPDCKVIERALEMTGYNQERAIEWILNNDLATGGDDAPAAPAAGGGGGGGGDGGVDGLVAQLQSLFSDVPKDKIRRALAQSGNNLEMAANIILGDF